MADDRPTLSFDEFANLGYVWLVWGLNIAPPRCDLIAIATTPAARTNYLEMGRQRGFDRVRAEKAFVNHAYGDGDLTRYLNGRDALSKSQEKNNG